jgi:hypothetical protein
MIKIVAFSVVALILGLVLGFFVGKTVTESKWSQPYAQISPAEEKKAASAKDAHPTPKAGTKILRPMPIGKARAALAAMTAKDPALATVVAFGAGEKGVELHVVIENHGSCTVKEASGVAYGFDPYGKPAKANAGGEPYLAFTLTSPIAPGKKGVVTAPMKHAELATLAVAHVDRTACTDGTTWARQ